MSVKKKSVGTGITKREEIQVEFTDSLTPEEEAAMRTIFESATRDVIADSRAFCGRVAGDLLLKRREAAQRVIAATTEEEKIRSWAAWSELPYPDVDSAPWFAVKVLENLQFSDSAREKGKFDEALRHVWQASAMFSVAAVKFTWEEHAISGQKSAKGGEEGNVAAYGTEEAKADRVEKFQAVADAVRADHPAISSAELWRRTSRRLKKDGASFCSVETLRKKCKDPAPPHPRKSKKTGKKLG